jgi:hypothetical protein
MLQEYLAAVLQENLSLLLQGFSCNNVEYPPHPTHPLCLKLK